MTMQIISLLFLVAAIALGFIRKLNVGVVALGLSLILAQIGGIGTKVLVSGFPSSLFLTLLGTMLYFSILQENGTIEKVSYRLVSLVGERTFLIPIMLYAVAFIMSAAGPGAISVQSIMILFGVTLALQLDANPLFFALMSYLGAVGGTTSPIAFTGILISDLSVEAGITYPAARVFAGIAAANLVLAVLFYIFFKGYRLRGSEGAGAMKAEKLNKNQIIGALSMLALMILVIILKYDVGLTAFTLSLLLVLIGCGNLGAAIKKIPWNIMILICGVSVLMAATKAMGGIDLLSQLLASVMSGHTASPLIALTAGIMSWFSSANGVVFPTLVPTLPGIAEAVGGSVTVPEMLMAMVSGGTATGISPFSTGGSLTLAASSQGDTSDAQQQSLFGKLIILSAVNVAVVIIFAFVGGYKLFG